MGRIKELFTDTMIYGVSSVLARFINYLLVPLYTRFFEPSEYGIIGLIYGAIIFLNVVFQFGMESAYLRYGADREKARDVFKSLQLSLLLGTTLLAGLFWLLGPALQPLMSLDNGGDLYALMLVILWLDALAVVPYSELRLTRRATTYALVRLVNVLINIGLNIYLIIFLQWGIEAVLVSNVIASAFSAVVLFGLTFRMLGGSWRTDAVKQALRFGIPYIPAGIGFAINEVIDRFFINNMSSGTVEQLYGAEYTAEDITGIYNACYKLAVFMMLAVQMFRMAWQPFFMRHAGEEGIRDTFSDVYILFNAGAAIVFLAVGLFAGLIVQIPVPLLDATVIDSRYWGGLDVVPVLLLAYWFHGWFVAFMPGIFIQEKTIRLPAITLTGAAVTIVLNTLLIPFYGMMGAAVATLICYAVMALMIYRAAQQVYTVPFELSRGFAMMAVAASFMWPGNYLAGLAVSDAAGNIITFLLALVAIAWIAFRKTSIRSLLLKGFHRSGNGEE